MRLPHFLGSAFAVAMFAISTVADEFKSSGPQVPWVRHTIDDSSRGADGVKLGDLNRDGLPDIVTGWEEGGEIHVCLNPGPARAHHRWPSIIVGKVLDAEDAIFIDLDSGGYPEILSCTEGKTRTVYVHSLWPENVTTKSDFADSRNWKTTPLPATKNLQPWMQALTLDIDGQWSQDLVVASKNPGGSIGWLQCPQDAMQFDQWRYQPLREASWIMTLASQDIDRDGDADLVFTDRKGNRSGLFWMENPGPEANRQFHPWKEHAIGGLGREVMFADIADINSDGRLDIAVATKPVEVLLFLQQPHSQWEPHVITLDASNLGDAKAVKAVDINQDQRLDLCFTCENAHGQREGVVWLEQLPGLRWQLHSLGGPAGVKFDLMQTLDLDADGDMDVITCEEREGLGVVWYENPHTASVAKQSLSRPRLAVLTDIGGDPDDQQSLVRLMTYANEFEIEALIASAAGTRGELKDSVTRPDLIREIIVAYGQVLPNLKRHADHWPEVDQLLNAVRSGNPRRERAHIGQAHDTEASQLLIERIEAGTPAHPLNITIWGGQTDLGQALWRAKQQRSAEEFAIFVSKLRVYDINDQDGIAEWMRGEFPGLNYILAKAPDGRDKREGTYRGMYLRGDESLTSLEWVRTNVLTRGPLGAMYPTKTFTAPNRHGCLKEGDTPSWFFFLPLGGNDPNDPTKPGWGGQFSRKPDGWWRDQPMTADFDPRDSVSRWRAAFQADFAKRMKWCLTDTPIEH